MLEHKYSGRTTEDYTDGDRPVKGNNYIFWKKVSRSTDTYSKIQVNYVF